MDVGVVGAGRVGTALGVLLARAGHRIVGASGRDGTRERLDRFLPHVPLLDPAETASRAEVVILAVPDDVVARTCADLAAAGAFRRGQAVVHLSGSLPLEALDPAASSEAHALSLHPLQTFPTVESALDRLPGSTMAVTARSEKAYGLGERLAADVGGRPFRLAEERKALYHAAAVFCSNYVVVVFALAERLFKVAGLQEPVAAFAPLARATVENVLEMGPEAALTGPAVRGDAGTIQRNLDALSSSAPEALPAYLDLAAVALDLAERAGRLTPDLRGRVEEVLAAWR